MLANLSRYHLSRITGTWKGWFENQRKVMTVSALITPRDANVAQIKDLVGHALRKSGISDEGAQLVIEQGGLLQQRIIPILQELAQPKGNPYEGEATWLVHFYPKDWKASSLEQQRERLLAAFPGLRLPDPVWDGNIPQGFDGVGYQVFPERLGLRHGIPDGSGANYGRLIEEVVLPALGRVYEANGWGYYNYRAGQLATRRLEENGKELQYIRLDERGRTILQERQEVTELDAFLAPVSLGQLWSPRTFSFRNTRETCFLSRVLLPLGTVQTGCHLVAMWERLTSDEHLYLGAAGDEYNWGSDDIWEDCPYFRFVGGGLMLDARGADDASEGFGSPVASLGV